ncbi:hypothetical protein ACP275_07G085300 [Erythranthe tilingii]
MGDNQDYHQQALSCDLTRVEFTTPEEETDDHDNQSKINLNFSWKVDFSKWIIPHAVEEYSTYPQLRRNMADHVLVMTLASVDNDILSEGRVLNFYFDALVDNQHIVFGEIHDDEFNSMVPAALKRVAVDCDQNTSCSICLEDLSPGGDK